GVGPEGELPRARIPPLPGTDPGLRVVGGPRRIPLRAEPDRGARIIADRPVPAGRDLVTAAPVRASVLGVPQDGTRSSRGAQTPRAPRPKRHDRRRRRGRHRTPSWARARISAGPWFRPVLEGSDDLVQVVMGEPVRTADHGERNTATPS